MKNGCSSWWSTIDKSIGIDKKIAKKSVLKVQNLEVKTEQMTFMNQSGQKRLRLMTTHNLIDDRSRWLKITLKVSFFKIASEASYICL